MRLAAPMCTLRGTPRAEGVGLPRGRLAPTTWLATSSRTPELMHAPPRRPVSFLAHSIQTSGSRRALLATPKIGTRTSLTSSRFGRLLILSASPYRSGSGCPCGTSFPLCGPPISLSSAAPSRPPTSLLMAGTREDATPATGVKHNVRLLSICSASSPQRQESTRLYRQSSTALSRK